MKMGLSTCEQTSYRISSSEFLGKGETRSRYSSTVEEMAARRALKLTGQPIRPRLNFSGEDTRSAVSSSGLQVPRWKRVLDVTLIVLASPVLIPLMLGIAVMIKLCSRGPVLFRQERIGYLGQRFTCLKFRSMAVGSDLSAHVDHCSRLMELNVPMEKIDGRDSRLILCGRLLRASGLDELPQVFNVLRGEMSLVGPRPCLSYECDKYLSWHKERFNTLPGLTGLWQVCGKNRTTFEEMMRLDIHYVRNKTLWADQKIIFATVAVLLTQIREIRKSSSV
jgi:lipopolysaccharide/colanic/teichoic acid biosynthesis glycosyltransferase